MIIYQYDGKIGEMGGIIVGFVFFCGYGFYFFCGLF